MHKRVVIFLIVTLLPAAESGSLESNDANKPKLKLIKKEPGKRYKKNVIITKDGERKVLVRVKKIKTDPNEMFFDDSSMLTDTYYLRGDETNATADGNRSITEAAPMEDNSSIAALAQTEELNSSMVPPPAELSVSQPDNNVTLLIDGAETDTHESEETLKAAETENTDQLPASNWKRHYFTFSAGSTARTRTTRVDTINLGSYVTLQNSDRALLADGSIQEIEETTSYAHVEAGYLYKPYIAGSSFYLSSYYDSDLIEFRAAYKYTLADTALFYPGIKVGGALTHDNGDDSEYDATAYFGGISLDRRLFNGMIVGVEYLYLKRQWIKKEEFFGTVTCQDQESALRLTLDLPLF